MARGDTPTGVVRRHLIDGCQMLGLSVGMKYERPYGDHAGVRDIRDGASLRLLFQAINTYSLQPAVDRLALLRWAIFQVLIGNADAHGKNLSFFVHSSGLSLAPAYDLVCIPALRDPRLSHTLAMAVGDAFVDQDITPFDWAQLGQQAGLRPAAMGKQMASLIDKTQAALPAVVQLALASGAPPDMAERVGKHVRQSCEAQLAAAEQIRHVKPDWL